jgi:hypothetical protein
MRDHAIFSPSRLRLAGLALCLSGLVACSEGGGIDLDPTTHHEVAKAPSVLTNPPPELKDGTAR